jgi:hypothetical protein
VTGKVTVLAGSELTLDFLNGFVPVAGDTFDFLQAGGGLTGLQPGCCRGADKRISVPIAIGRLKRICTGDDNAIRAGRWTHPNHAADRSVRSDWRQVYFAS